jgi:hypothetical protein
MNRKDYTELLADIKRELSMEGGHFDALFGTREDTMKQADFIAAVALVAADRLYSRITRDASDLREKEARAIRGDDPDPGETP